MAVTQQQQQKEQEAPGEIAARERYEQLRAELLQKVAQAKSAAALSTPNRLGAQYIIHTSQPLQELNAGLARAFAAGDEKDPTRSLYALVCDPKVPVRAKVVKSLTGTSVPYMTPLVTSGITEVSGFGGRRMVLLYERPKGKPLSAVLAEQGNRPLPEHFIMERILGPLGAAVSQCAEMGFSHGRINPANIFYGDAVMLGECAAEPCGYAQPYLFEPPPRAQAHPAGKGEGNPAQDFFALGVLAAYLRVGPRLFEHSKTPEEHLLRLLREGSYLGIAQNIDFSDAMTDLLRGTLNDSVKERWTWQQLKLWTGGRRFNMLPPAIQPPGSRTFAIDKAEYKNLRDLAQGLYSQWDLTARLLRDESVTRWVELSARRKDLGELLRKTMLSLSGGSGHQVDEAVARGLTILDADAPMSMKEVRMHMDGVGAMLAEAMRTGIQQHTQHAVEIIEQALPSVWADMHRRRDEELSNEHTNALWMLERVRQTLRLPSLGFGLERCVYDLCPDLSCQSPLLGKHYVYTLKDLLQTLDRLAPEKARAEPPIDRHIAAYIGSKLNLSREVWLSSSNQLDKLAQKHGLVALKLFQQAQESAGKVSVPGLTAWVSVELLEVVENFHSKTVREQLEAGLTQLAGGGQFGPIYDFMNQKVFVDADLTGYKQCVQRYRAVQQEIARLRNKAITRQRAARTGYLVAKYIAYVALITMVVLTLQKRL